MSNRQTGSWHRKPAIQPRLPPIRKSLYPKTELAKVLFHTNRYEQRCHQRQQEALAQEREWGRRVLDQHSRSFVVRQILQEHQLRARGGGFSDHVSLLPPDLVESHRNLALFHNMYYTGAKDLPLHHGLNPSALKLLQGDLFKDYDQAVEEELQRSLEALPEVSAGTDSRRELKVVRPERGGSKRSKSTLNFDPITGQRVYFYGKVSSELSLTSERSKVAFHPIQASPSETVHKDRGMDSSGNEDVVSYSGDPQLTPTDTLRTDSMARVQSDKINTTESSPGAKPSCSRGVIKLPPIPPRLSQQQIRRFVTAVALRRQQVLVGSEDTQRQVVLGDSRYSHLCRSLVTGSGKKGYESLNPVSWTSVHPLSPQTRMLIRRKYLVRPKEFKRPSSPKPLFEKAKALARSYRDLKETPGEKCKGGQQPL